MDDRRMAEVLTLRCACGWEVRGSEDEVVDATSEHGERLHNMTATREQILAMATRTAASGAMAVPSDTPA